MTIQTIIPLTQMLGQHRRRWAHTKTTQGQCHVFTGNEPMLRSWPNIKPPLTLKELN